MKKVKPLLVLALAAFLFLTTMTITSFAEEYDSGLSRIESVESPLRIELTTQCILHDTDLTDLVTGGDGWSHTISTATVTTDSGAEVEVDLAAGKDGVVDWKLYAGTGTPTWSRGISPDNEELPIATELSDVDEAKSYYLMAQLDKESLKAHRLAAEKNTLLLVPIKLYSWRDHSFPLQLTEGNSDLYWNFVE